MSTHNIPYQYRKRKSPDIIPNTIMSSAIGFFLLRTQERVRNNVGKGKAAIGVRATEVLL